MLDFLLGSLFTLASLALVFKNEIRERKAISRLRRRDEQEFRYQIKLALREYQAESDIK